MLFPELQIPRGPSIRPRLLYLALVIFLIANVVLNAAWVGIAYGGLKDLDSFLHSGAAYARGLDPYQYYAWMRPEPISKEALNLNPPISVYLFQPLSSLDRDLVAAGFLAGSIAMVAASAGLLLREYPEKRHWLVVLIVASMAGIWHMLWYLQIYAPLLLAVTGAWLLLRRERWLLAGLLIGLVIAIKPNYALVALILLAAGHYRPAAWAMASALAISLVPLVLDGPGIYLQWLHMTMGFEGYAWTSNASLVSVGERMGFEAAGQLMAGAVGIGAVAFAWRSRPSALDATALALMTVILVGPVSWAGYTLLLLPFLFSERWEGWTWASILILVTPFAPERAIASLGIDFPELLSASARETVADTPGLLVNVVNAIARPLLGAMYAWAVILLMSKHGRRLAEASDLHLPEVSVSGLGQAIARGLRRLRSSQPADKPSIPDAAPVRVRYDA